MRGCTHTHNVVISLANKASQVREAFQIGPTSSTFLLCKETTDPEAFRGPWAKPKAISRVRNSLFKKLNPGKVVKHTCSEKSYIIMIIHLLKVAVKGIEHVYTLATRVLGTELAS